MNNLGYNLSCTFYAEQGTVDTQIVALSGSPLLAGIVVVVIGASSLLVVDKLTSCIVVHIEAVGYFLDAHFFVGCNKDAKQSWLLAQDIVGTTAYEYAVVLFGSFPNGLALYLEQGLLRHGITIEIAGSPAQSARERTEERLEGAMTLVLILKDARVEAAALSRHIDKFVVVVFAVKTLCQQLCYLATATAQLSAYADNEIVHGWV